MFAKIYGCAFAVLLAIVCISFSGCSSPKYDIECSIVESNSEPGFKVTIRGPANKVAVLMITPDNKVETAILEKECLMANSASIVFWQNYGLSPGKYRFCAKMFDTEKIVGEREVIFNLEELKITDFKLTTGKHMFYKGFTVKEIAVFVKKRGDTPVLFLAAGVKIDDRAFVFKNCNALKGNLLSGETGQITISCASMLPNTFLEGDRKITVTLVYLQNGKEKHIDLTKEIHVAKD